MKARIIVLALIFVVSGCMTTSKIMESWIGSSEESLLASWGSPDLSTNLDNGQKVYTWKRIWSNSYGTHQGRQTFTISPSGTVTKWSYENMPGW